MPKLSQEQKISYLDFALRLSGLAVREHHIDLIIGMYDVILKKGDKFNLKDMAIVKADNCGKYAKEIIAEENKIV